MIIDEIPYAPSLLRHVKVRISGHRAVGVSRRIRFGVEDMSADMLPDLPCDLGNNPRTAVLEYHKNQLEFEIEKSIQNKLLITVAPDGYLKRIS